MNKNDEYEYKMWHGVIIWFIVFIIVGLSWSTYAFAMDHGDWIHGDSWLTYVGNFWVGLGITIWMIVNLAASFGLVAGIGFILDGIGD